MLNLFQNYFSGLHPRLNIIRRYCDPIKKILSSVSPLTPLIYAIITLLFSIKLPEALYMRNICILYSWLFIIYSFLNSLYQIFNKKKIAPLLRRTIVNFFYLGSLCIISYFLFTNYINVILSNPVNFIENVKLYVTGKNSFKEKIWCLLKLTTQISTSLFAMWNSYNLFKSLPSDSHISIYRKQGTQKIIRRNNEYINVDFNAAVLSPLIGIILNFFTVNEPTTYCFLFASILHSFEFKQDNKYHARFLPFILTVISNVIILLNFLVSDCHRTVLRS